MRKLGGLRLMVIGLAASASLAASPAAAAQKKVLLFSHSTGYRHASIEPGVAALKQLGQQKKLDVVASEDPNVFSEAGLKGVDAIIFLSTSTDPKKPESEWFQGARRTALQNFVRRGGGVVAIHAASDSHYHWDWYQRMIGGHFASHPEGTPEGEIHVEDRNHPSTAKLPARVKRVDEWYYFDDYNPKMKLLVTLDPKSIGQKDVNPNPVSWAHEYEGGRVFYTAMGHTPESFRETNFLEHIAGGLTWVMTKRK